MNRSLLSLAAVALALAGCGSSSKTTATTSTTAAAPAVAKADLTRLLAHLPPDADEGAAVDVAKVRALLHLPANADALDVLDPPGRLFNAVSAVLYPLQQTDANVARGLVDGRRIVAAASGYGRSAAVIAIQTSEPASEIEGELKSNGYVSHNGDGSFVFPEAQTFDDFGAVVIRPGVVFFSNKATGALDAANFVSPISHIHDALAAMTTPVRSARLGAGCLRGTTMVSSVAPDKAVLTLNIKGTPRASRFRGAAFPDLAKTWTQVGPPSVRGHYLQVQLDGKPKGGSTVGMLLADPEMYRC